MLLRTIAKIILNSRIAFENKKRKSAFLPWERIEKIALIMSKKDNVNKSLIDSFISGTRKYVEVYYIELDSKTNTYHDWNCFNKKDKTLLGLPSKSVTQGLTGRKFDVV